MKKRYIIYLSLIGLILVQIFVPPVLPVIQLPGEVLWKWSGGKEFAGGLFGGGFTNTFLATILTFLLILLLAFSLRARSRTADEVPTGFYNFFEMIIEFAFGYVENAAGKWAKTFFPFFMTFILWIVVANWMELIPFVDAFGLKENLVHHEVELAEEKAAAEGVELSAEAVEKIETEAMEKGGNFAGNFWLVKAGEGEEAGQTVVPFVRAAATDLNFTLALAIISVVMTQYYGMKAQGMSYWKKFFVWDAEKIKQSPLAVMDTGVGLLEFVSEIFKIVSFAFRLLGNIFAGQVLLFVIAALLPIANLLFWHLEFFVGILQAGVFALLTLTFMTAATQSHHAEEAH